MAYLANTAEYVVEFDQSPVPHLFITRKSDSRSVMIEGKGLAGMFRKDLKRSGPDRTISCYIRMLGNRVEWQQIYKPGKHPVPAEWERIG